VLSCGFKAITPFLEPIEEDDIFDLASLTKPLALAFVFMKKLSAFPDLDIFKTLGNYIETGSALDDIPIYRFLNHSAGLKAWYPFYKEEELYENKYLSLKKVIKKIKNMPFEYNPGEKSVYSDLGFFLLTYFLETYYKKSFEKLFLEVKKEVRFSKRSFIDFLPLLKGVPQERIVPTSVSEEGKILRGVVEDENTRAMGGVSGVAGLFANIYALFDILESFLLSYYGKNEIVSQEVIKLFWKYKEEKSDFALGFMLQSKEGYSATGKAFSKNTVGHTGFTGTSFFIDPERELIAILLTNRVHPNRKNTKIKDFRVEFHTLVSEIFK